MHTVPPEPQETLLYCEGDWILTQAVQGGGATSILGQLAVGGLAWVEGETRWPPQVPFNSNHSMIWQICHTMYDQSDSISVFSTRWLALLISREHLATLGEKNNLHPYFWSASSCKQRSIVGRYRLLLLVGLSYYLWFFRIQLTIKSTQNSLLVFLFPSSSNEDVFLDFAQNRSSC